MVRTGKPTLDHLRRYCLLPTHFRSFSPQIAVLRTFRSFIFEKARKIGTKWAKKRSLGQHPAGVSSAHAVKLAIIARSIGLVGGDDQYVTNESVRAKLVGICIGRVERALDLMV